MYRRSFLFSAVAAVAALGLGSGLWLVGPSSPEELVIRVNLPAYELEVWEGDEVIRSYPVTIGAPGYTTPTGEHLIDRAVWNPWWHPPDSRWAHGEEKTPPGPTNPMGRAKLRFEGLLYIHGTSREDQLGQAVSHGCIRMANADVLELARLIAERRDILPPSDLEALEADSRATRDEGIDPPVRLIVSYRLAEKREGEVRQYDDVYGRGMRPHEREMVENGTSGTLP